MPTTYQDQFYVLDPANPPASGTVIDFAVFDIIDRNNDNWISKNVGDRVDGQRVEQVWVDDTVTVVIDGVTQTITGVTFYLRDGRAVFTPTDGSVLEQAVFVSSNYVSSSTQTPVGDFGPPCFTQGTLILTDQGEKPVEWLRPGDLVMTHDEGAQPIRWIGQRRVVGRGRHAPIRFAPGAIGNSRALSVSPQHRVLISDWRAELYCGANEVLVAAKHLVDGRRISIAPKRAVTYFHLLFDRHQIVMSDGAATESFFPGATILEEDPGIRAELAHLAIPLSPEAWKTARPVVRGAELVCLAA